MERAFSAYLYRRKHGICEVSFENALQERPEIFESSLYAHYLREYIKWFPAQDVLAFAFDDLRQDPQVFANQICERLAIPPIELPAELRAPKLKAAQARSLWIAKLVKKMALAARKRGLVNLIGRLKTNRLVQTTLYRDFADGEKPTPDPQLAEKLRNRAQASVRELDEMIGTDFCQRWGY